MIGLKLISTDDYGKPIEILAKTAKDLGNGKALLDKPISNFLMENGLPVKLTADIGNLNQSDGSVKLKGSVDIKSENGYELHAPSATIDIREKVAESFEPVFGKGPKGEIRAEDGLKASADGVVFFKGKTKLVVYGQKNTPTS